jgi:hypothetical protein
MPDCSNQEAAYELAVIAEAVAAAAWAVEQAEADLKYYDLMDATTAKWSAWMAYMYCLSGFGGTSRAASLATEARTALRELKVQNLKNLIAHRDELIARADALKAAK